MSNFTDLDALAAEPGVLVRYATRPEELADADLVVLPGTRATVADLAWLRETGMAAAVGRHAAEGRPLLGICGGHQMLARTITDDVESRAGTVDGLGLLPAEVRFAQEKTLGRPVGEALGEPVRGYEIHHGVVTVDESAEPFLDGARRGSVFGTTWHGALENDGFRRAFLTEVAGIAGRRFAVAPGTDFAALRDARLERLGDVIAEHADTDTLWRLIEKGPPAGLPCCPRGRPSADPAPRPAVVSLPASRDRSGGDPVRSPRGPVAATGEPVPGAGDDGSGGAHADGIDLRHHGDAELAPGLVDLAVNVRAGAPPHWLLGLLHDAIDRSSGYPDPGPARAAVAAAHGRDQGEVLLTAGAAETFTLVARALAPRRAVVVHPSFTEPEAALRSAGHPVERLLLPPEDGYRLDPAAVPDDADLVVLGNPTNPTSVLHPAADLAQLLRSDRVVVVDEAFADTVPGEPESLASLAGLPGLLVVRSLTKTWGLAGLRVGYALGPPDLVGALAAQQPHWPVSTPALAALAACTTPSARAEAEAAARALGTWRQALLDSLPAAVVVVGTPRSSFVLLRVTDGIRVRQELRRRGWAVRRGDTFPGLTGDHLRVAVREPTVARAFAAALTEVLETPPATEAHS
ncbi:Rv2231c family pyridoxal phosphate-dependent protein CobC [Blastococcus brunescens]|uniref:Aminotransferase n=1 Tax=Blastococcus brunescens TaxID=1564165 RepID=A0ABZ1B398_9ACTN|nr:Rv2231c family pyridoxal phosphate-dependent protein CobC [Blastococcus sp. BMG 8361]WRL65274.1 Rv2231c family pyridoxal phosphate-dependent protein CobC [Blastococcus sp. BMG 8361]